jgi:ABC-type lipoprotein export system ATPase subunit
MSFIELKDVKKTYRMGEVTILVFQFYNLVQNLTSLENVELALQIWI